MTIFDSRTRRADPFASTKNGAGLALPTRARNRSTQLGDDVGYWRSLDSWIVLLVVGLGVFGITMIYSSSRGSNPQAYVRLYTDRQSIYLLLGLVLMFATAWLSHQKVKLGSWIAYGTAVLLLVLVLTPLGSEQRGTRAWFDLPMFQFQVSEFAKVALILALASLIADGKGVLSNSRLATALLVAGTPILLLVLEPDVGTAVIFMVISVSMIVVGGVRIRQAMLLGILSAVGVGLLLSSSALADYQRARLTVFVNSDSTEVDTYNVEQAQIAIGNGGLTGQGYGQGFQTQSGRVPEQHTDFIFTAIGEELGFIGATAVVLLYLLLLWRVMLIGRKCADRYGKLLATGVLTMLAFQAFQAAGMAVGIMPVTGIPFPLLSYGGSSMLITCVSLGLVLGLETSAARAGTAPAAAPRRAAF